MKIGIVGMGYVGEAVYKMFPDAVYGDDPRFNLYWTFIFPEKRGAKSKCIPKDVIAWASWAESVGHTAGLTKALLFDNSKYFGGDKLNV